MNVKARRRSCNDASRRLAPWSGADCGDMLMGHHSYGVMLIVRVMLTVMHHGWQRGLTRRPHTAAT